MIIAKSIVITSIIMALLLIVGCVETAPSVPANNNTGEGEQQAEETVPTNEVDLPEMTNDGNKEETAPIQTIRVKENELVKLKPTVTDPDGDPVTWSFSAPLSEKGEWRTTYGDAGEYTVTLSATDSKLVTTQQLTLIVERVNVAPKIAGVRDMIVREGELVRFDPKITDANDDAITLTISEPLKSGTFATDHTSAGEYSVTVVASDGELESQSSFKLTVLDLNVKPEIKNIQDLTVAEGETVTLRPQVTDLDEDDVQITISEPVGNDGEWKTDYTNHGEYFVTITADDGKDKVTRKVRIVVGDVNKAPEIVDVSLERK
ncbi:PKD domain-containing protein [Candidatus Woesearchaeota archaeon]|nr:PKD domain-containing protein [Candidatus Woesearchaeota archaeon]